jgi:hypothetical protein
MPIISGSTTRYIFNLLNVHFWMRLIQVFEKPLNVPFTHEVRQNKDCKVEAMRTNVEHDSAFVNAQKPYCSKLQLWTRRYDRCCGPY